MYGYIYITTNSKNGMKYIGQKKSNTFLGNKYLGSGVKLIEAVEEFGKDEFNVELLESCNSLNELNICELYWIWYFNAIYNQTYYNSKFGSYSNKKSNSVLDEFLKLNCKNNKCKNKITISTEWDSSVIMFCSNECYNRILNERINK